MILRGNVASKVLGKDTGITVIIPENLIGEKYKVAYMLHGLGGDNNTIVENTMLPVYAKRYSTIFVLPDGQRSFYTDMKYGQKFFTYISEELPELCKKMFNISANRDNTAIMGCSMGGYGALKVALRKPESYGHCCAFASPCLFLKEGLDLQREIPDIFRSMYGQELMDDFVAIFGEDLKWYSEDEILEVVKKIPKRRTKPSIYITCGTKDPFKDFNDRFVDEMKKLKVKVDYEVFEGKHDDIFFDTSIRKALEKLYKDNN